MLEEALNRHPKLRLNVMHGGWPYLQETIALLFMYPQVYTDLGAIDWALPRAEFHAYLGALMRAGFGKRVLFGSDQMYWPEAIGMAVDAIDAATFLTHAEQAGHLLRQRHALSPPGAVEIAVGTARNHNRPLTGRSRQTPAHLPTIAVPAALVSPRNEGGNRWTLFDAAATWRA